MLSVNVKDGQGKLVKDTANQLGVSNKTIFSMFYETCNGSDCNEHMAVVRSTYNK